MTIVQTNSLPLPLETFTQPCAEQRKSLVEQTEEITVELLLESNDIQLFGNKLRFLVAPQNERELQQCNSFFITLCICCKTVGRNSTPDYAAGQTIRPRKRFPAFRSGSRKKYEGKTGIGLNDYFCIGTNRRKHEKTLDRLHRITYRRPDRIPLHPLLLRFGEGVKSGELNYVVYKGLVFKTYEGKLIQSIRVEDAAGLYENGTVTGGMIPKLNCCIDAIEQGVEKVMIVDGRGAFRAGNGACHSDLSDFHCHGDSV